MDYKKLSENLELNRLNWHSTNFFWQMQAVHGQFYIYRLPQMHYMKIKRPQLQDLAKLLITKTVKIKR